MARQIKFTIGGFFGGYKTIEIYIHGDMATYKILRNGLLNVDKKISPAVKMPDAWFAELDALNIFDWEKDNFNADILDGTQWELIFKDDTKIYRGGGSNAYPENWERFLDWLDALIPEMEFVDRKRLEKITLDYSRESAMGYMISEKLTLDHREKILTIDKKNAQPFATHIYRIEPVKEKLFDAAQKFCDGLEVDETETAYPAQIKIELVFHDGSIKNFETLYNERCLPGLTEFIDVIKSVVTDLTTEIFKPLPAEIESAKGKYIFCKVKFDGSYKHYTYQTDDETLAVGDIVDVPVGKNNDVTQARIVEIGYFDEYEAPFPIGKIKKIIGKHVATEWENY